MSRRINLNKKFIWFFFSFIYLQIFLLFCFFYFGGEGGGGGFCCFFSCVKMMLEIRRNQRHYFIFWHEGTVGTKSHIASWCASKVSQAYSRRGDQSETTFCYWSQATRGSLVRLWNFPHMFTVLQKRWDIYVFLQNHSFLLKKKGITELISYNSQKRCSFFVVFSSRKLNHKYWFMNDIWLWKHFFFSFETVYNTACGGSIFVDFGIIFLNSSSWFRIKDCWISKEYIARKTFHVYLFWLRSACQTLPSWIGRQLF